MPRRMRCSSIMTLRAISRWSGKFQRCHGAGHSGARCRHRPWTLTSFACDAHRNFRLADLITIMSSSCPRRSRLCILRDACSLPNSCSRRPCTRLQVLRLNHAVVPCQLACLRFVLVRLSHLVPSLRKFYIRETAPLSKFDISNGSPVVFRASTDRHKPRQEHSLLSTS